MPEDVHARWDLPPAHLLELIYETMSDGVAVYDTSGHILYCNPAMCLLAGRPVQDLVGKSAAEAWGHPANKLTRPPSATSAEERIRRPDGSEKVVTVKSFGLTSTPPMQVHVYRDVTRIRETRLALEESYRIFHAFMANYPAVATIKDPAGQYVYVNPLAEEIFGRPSDQWTGRDDAALFPAELAQALMNHDNMVRLSSECLQFDEILPTINGPRHFHTVRYLMTDGHDHQLLASISLDVSYLVTREEETARRDEMVEILLEIMETLSSASTQDMRKVLVLLGAAIETTCGTIAVRKAKGLLDVIQHHWSGGSEPGSRSQPRWDLPEEETPWLMKSLAEGRVDIADLTEAGESAAREIERLHAGKTRAFLAVPIRGNDNSLLGFVAVEDHTSERDWSNAEIRMLETVARMLALHLPRR